MEFIHIRQNHIYIQADTKEREMLLRALVEKFIQAIKAIQKELK
jgi:hypothetical protein